MKKNKAYLGFIAPGFIIYSLFVVVPIIFAIYYSFFRWNGIGPMEFIGLDNYFNLFFEPRLSKIFLNALFNNLKYLLCVWLIITPIQFLFAYCLYLKIRAHKYIQLMLFLPYVISSSIVGFFCMLVFDPNIGFLNETLGALGLSELKSAWIGDPDKVFIIFVMVVIWQSIGSGMMIFYANMREISSSIIEASIIDGAGEWQKLTKIIIPQCIASIITNIVLSTIFALTVFDIPYLLGGATGGVNNKIDFISMVFYRTAFGGKYYGETSMGLGAAISVTTFLIIMIAYSIQQAILRKHEFDK